MGERVWKEDAQLPIRKFAFPPTGKEAFFVSSPHLFIQVRFETYKFSLRDLYQVTIDIVKEMHHLASYLLLADFNDLGYDALIKGLCFYPFFPAVRIQLACCMSPQSVPGLKWLFNSLMPGQPLRLLDVVGKYAIA